MKTTLLVSAACLFACSLLPSCGTSTGEATEKTNDQMKENRSELDEARAETEEEWRNERTEAMKELRDLRTTLENQRIREQKRLNDGIKDVGEKAECQALIAELNTNILRIDAALVKMEASSSTDWDKVKAEARQTADEAATWWERQKEKVDKKTDADKDGDGH